MYKRQLRDGNLVMTKSAKETDMNELIAAMVGRVLENRFPPVDNQPKDVVLSVQHLSTKFEPYLQDVSFDVREGEIFGLYLSLIHIYYQKDRFPRLQ